MQHYLTAQKYSLFLYLELNGPPVYIQMRTKL